MRKTITYSGFVIASIVVILAFVTATTYTQLAIAIVLYPLLAYFAFKILPHKTWKAPVISIQLPKVKPAQKVETEVVKSGKQDVNIKDIDKRAFLKLIGATGISFFIISIFGRRIESLLFGNALEPRTETPSMSTPSKTDTANNSTSLEGYKISEIDEDVISYYGFINREGSWLIMREDTDMSSFRYAKGDFNFSNSWSNRKNLKYDYFYKLF